MYELLYFIMHNENGIFGIIYELSIMLYEGGDNC